MNLLSETIADITQSGHTPEDIVFIGSRQSGHRCTWDEFCLLANREYDCSFGAQEVAQDLEIVFSDGCSMWREEYDGSERWAYAVPFEEPSESHKIKNLFATPELVGWRSLEELNPPTTDTPHTDPPLP